MTTEKKVFKHQPTHWINQPSVDAITDQRLDYFDRCLLLYMSYRFGYFKDELKKPYFESTQTLADVFGVHRNTVSKAIQTLKALGYIDITTKRGGSNTYTNVTTWLNGAAPAGSDAQKKQLPKAQDIRPRQVVENKPTPQVAKNWYDDDDDLVPF